MPETPPLTTSPVPRVFISYSRKDEKWREKLRTFLRPAIDAKSIAVWDDRNIEAGEVWNREIDEAINTSKVAVILISPDYLASSWIMEQEVPHLLSQMREGKLRLLPIMLRPSPWQQVDWLKSIQIFPGDLKPLVGSRAQDKLFVEAAQRIVKLATEQTSSSTPIENSSETPAEPVSPSEGIEATVDALSSFVLSNEARDILQRARVLGTFGDTLTPKVTSTCLLFAISEGGRDQTAAFRIPQFFWRELQRADPEAYRQIFYERFPRAVYSSVGERTIAFDRFDTLAETISENVWNIFQRAQKISRETLARASSKYENRPRGKGVDAETQYPGHIGGRHLLAALLVLEETNAIERLSRILDVPQLRDRFLDFIGKSLPDDDLEAWQQVLGVEVPTAEDEEPISATKSEQDLARLSGYSGDYWEGEDLLGITRDVNALASLVAARSIDPPLSIGLFGDWGSGKTHFMRQMRARVQKLSQKTRDSGKPQSQLGYHKKIVQIEFNAWHYIEGNLWASLVEHIFNNLRVTGQRDGRTEVDDAREKIMEQLGLKQELQKKVEQHQEELKTKANEAEGRAQEARNKRDGKTDDLSKLRAAPERGLMDELPKIQVSPDQQALLKQLGIPEGTRHLPSEIYKKYQQAQTTWGRIRAQWDVFRAEPNRMSQLIRVLVVVAITVAAGVIFRSALKSAWGYLASIVAFVAAAWKAAKPYFDKFKQSMVALEKEYVEVEKERQKQIVELESEVNSLTREMNAAENEAKALNKEVSTLETQLKSTDAARLLAGFIESRAAAEDYRRHLGVLALIRRDFEKLSNLLSEQRRDERENGDVTEDQKAFSRIILYIDDLDRCPPERVVQVLQAIHLLLAFPLFVVVVGVDARWVTRSLQESYDWLGVNGDEDKNKEDQREPNQDKREMVDDRTVTPHDYLEKIFQIPFWLKPMGQKDCANLLDGLTKDSRENSATPQNETVKNERPRQETMAAPANVSDKNLPVPSVLSETLVEPALVSDDPPEIVAASNQSAVKATIAEPTGGALTATSAQAVNSQTELKIAETIQADNEQIDLAPQSLTLSGDEIEFMKSLTPLIGRSPRAVKRFLNCYRLIKVGLRPGELEAFMGQNGQSGRYPAIMLLLGIITGAPSVSLHIIEELEEYARSKKTMNLNTLLTRLEANPDVARQADWSQVREILEDKIGFDDSGVALQNLMRETPRVSRYSFRVAKAAAGPKRMGAGKAAKDIADRSGTSAQPIAI